MNKCWLVALFSLFASFSNAEDQDNYTHRNDTNAHRLLPENGGATQQAEKLNLPPIVDDCLYGTVVCVVGGGLLLRTAISPIQCIFLPVTLVGRVALGVSLEYCLGSHNAVEENSLYRVYNAVTTPICFDCIECCLAPGGC